jgi:hypothetical protein
MPVTDPLASDAITIARTYLNDDSGLNYSTAFLLPKVAEAHRNMQARLWVVGSPLVRVEVGLNIPVGNVNITPFMPNDMLVPYSMMEFDSVKGWIPVTEVFFFDHSIPSNNNFQFWTWSQEILSVYFTTNPNPINILVRYRRLIPVPTATTSSLGVLSSERYIGLMVAGMAAGSLANLTGLDKANELADEFWNNLITANRGKQTPVGSP